MAIESVWCPVCHADVIRVTNLEGEVRAVNCSQVPPERRELCPQGRCASGWAALAAAGAGVGAHVGATLATMRPGVSHPAVTSRQVHLLVIANAEVVMGTSIIALPHQRAAKLGGDYAGSSLTIQIVQWIARWSCWMHGHMLLAHRSPHRLSLRCEWCGYETAGWDIEPGRDRRSSCGRMLRHSPRAIRQTRSGSGVF